MPSAFSSSISRARINKAPLHRRKPGLGTTPGFKILPESLTSGAEPKLLVQSEPGTDSGER